MIEPLPKHSPAWWNSTRAALARLFGPVQVRQVMLEEAPAAALGAASDAVEWPAPACGLRETGWLPQTKTKAWHPPAARVGGGGLDGSDVPCFVAGNAVPYLAHGGVHDGGMSAFAPVVRAASLELGANGDATALALPVRLSGGETYALPVVLPAPTVRAAAAMLSGLPRMGARRDKGTGVPAFAPPRTLSRLDKMTRVPILRRRAMLPAGADALTAFEAERRALAAACGGEIGDVKLLASFPHVPLSLVQHMAATPDGDALRVWLRSPALASGAGWTAAQVTIVLGRRRDTGEAIRAVLPEAMPPERKQ